MRRLWDLMRGYRRLIVLAPLFKMLEAAFELIVPLIVRAMIDRGIGGGDGAFIGQMGWVLLLLAVVGMISSITAQYFAADAAIRFSKRTRHELLYAIQNLSSAAVDSIGIPTLITRMTSDVLQVQSGVNLTLRLFLRSPFVVFGAMVMAFTIDARVALVFVLAIIALSVVVFGIMKISIPLYRAVQGSLDGVLTLVRENLTGARVLRAFGSEDRESEAFHARHEALTSAQRFVGRVSALLNPLTYVLVNGALIALLWTGAVRVEGGALTQGSVVALVSYLAQILIELIKMANLIVTITRAMACWGRLDAVLALPRGMDAPAVTRGAVDPVAPAVEFVDASIRYSGAGAEALSQVTFAAPRGSTIGVIGGTGSGKSTLVNLIPRFYDVTGGQVRIGGIDVKDWATDDLRAAVGVVPQKAELFAGTVAENLRWGDPNAPDDVLEGALRTAQAYDFVMAMPGGLDYRLEARGRNLSGGQRQRLTIARALVKRPQILILDDSASALDYATDAALRRAIAAMTGEMTVFIVSQRAASVMMADWILVLDDGRVARQGKHDDLMRTCEIYREIYRSQFAKEAV